jgi:ABC-type glycerol-3-phosphate transport system permease component
MVRNDHEGRGEEISMQVDTVRWTKKQRPIIGSFSVVLLRRALRYLILYILAGLVSLICLIPVIWMIKTSFETPEFMRSARIQFWPIQPTLDNYRSVLQNPNAMIARSTLNSLVVAFLATLLNIALTATAGYALSRFNFRGKLIFGMYLLAFYMIPRTLLLIGMFGILARLGLINNLMGLVITYSAVGIPLATWWLKAYFDSIPIEIEEQARIDGCNRLGVLRWIIVPLALPGVAAVGIFLFIDAWNEYVLALTIIQSPNLRLLPVQIVNFMGLQRIEWGPVMAFSVIVATPAVILFALVQRNIISGLMSGFTK